MPALELAIASASTQLRDVVELELKATQAWWNQPITKRGEKMNPAKEYFKSLFEDDGDCAMFLYKFHAHHVKRGEIAQSPFGFTTVSGGLGRWEVYDKAPGEEGAKLNSNPMAPDDSRLLPAIVEHYFYNNRHRKAENPHYFWLHWYVHGEGQASMKVERGEDGQFPIVAYDQKLQMLVKGAPADVWAQVSPSRNISP